MYTLPSPLPRPSRRCLAIIMLALAVVAHAAQAQNPQRLPGRDITAKRPGPGPKLFGGIVRDTAEFPLEGVEVSIPDLQRRLFTNADGSFRFDSMPTGKYSVRARKFGYAPQVRNIEVDSMGAAVDFALIPAPRALPSVVVSAVRGGLSGTIADTAYDYILGAEVSVLGKDMRTLTDSSGTFYLPAPEGHYMVAIRKEGYDDRLVSVTIPPDSGRRITSFLMPSAGARPHREAWNIRDLQTRMARRNKITTAFYTREDLKKLSIDWVYDAVNLGGQGVYDKTCSVILDGGPRTANVSTLTVDDIESVEVYGGARSGKNPVALRTDELKPPKGGQPARQAGRKPNAAGFKAPVPTDNADHGTIENRGKDCVLAYVWSR